MKDITELLGVAQDHTNNIVQDRFDNHLYKSLMNESEELFSLSQKGSDTFPSLLQDIWATFYKAYPQLTAEAQVKPSHKGNRAFIERIMEEPATEAARVTTMLDELSAALATLEAGRSLLEELQNRPELKKALEEGSNAARDLRRAARKSIKAGLEKSEELQLTLGGWGLHPEDLKTMPIGERLELVKKLMNPQMRNISAIAGRLKNLARGRQKQKVKLDRDEVHGISVGSDLAHILPAELGTLKHPLRKKDFYRRFTEGQLLQYELTAKEPVGRGPIVCLVDASGSMGGNKMDWATGVALSLLDTTKRQKRHFSALFFNRKIVLHESITPKENNAEKILKLATVAATGGTDFELPLAEAVSIIQSQKDYHKADIVMITDGECQLSEEALSALLSAKEALGFRIWTLVIGTEHGSVEQFSDRIWVTPSLSDTAAGDIFEEVYQ